MGLEVGEEAGERLGIEPLEMHALLGAKWNAEDPAQQLDRLGTALGTGLVDDRVPLDFEGMAHGSIGFDRSRASSMWPSG